MPPLSRVLPGIRRRIHLFLKGQPDQFRPDDAPQMVQVIFNGVLHRSPEPSALAAYTAALASGGLKIDAMIDELMHLPEVQIRYQTQRSADPIIAAYRIILRRDPSEMELNLAMKRLQSGVGYTDIFRELSSGPEVKRSTFREALAEGGVADLILASIDTNSKA